MRISSSNMIVKAITYNYIMVLLLKFEIVITVNNKKKFVGTRCTNKKATIWDEVRHGNELANLRKHLLLAKIFPMLLCDNALGFEGLVS